MSLDDIWSRKSKIFINEGKLLIDYVPETLPHRTAQIRRLGSLFKPFISPPGSTNVKVILTGDVGTGKTVVAKYFGLKVEKFSRSRRFFVKYVHVNAHKDRTLFLAMQHVGRELSLQIPRRGFSSQELIHLIWNNLEARKGYLLLTVDEAGYLVKTSGTDVLYDLTRISEEMTSDKQRISLIFIFRDLSILSMLEKSVRSSLMHNIVRFEPYSSKELTDILSERISREKAMRPSVVDQGILELIGDITGSDKGGNGDARLALELLWRGGKYAEEKNSTEVTAEHIRRAYSDIFPSFPKQLLYNLSLHEKVLLLALTRTLLRKSSGKVPLGDVEQEYGALCEEYGKISRGHTTIWEYVQNLKNMGIVSAEKSGRGYRGKTTLIGIPHTPLTDLMNELEKLLSSS